MTYIASAHSKTEWSRFLVECSQRYPAPPPEACEAEAIAVHWPEMRNTTAFRRYATAAFFFHLN